MQGISEASDATTRGELCVMRNLTPAAAIMPKQPDGLKIGEEGEIQVA